VVACLCSYPHRHFLQCLGLLNVVLTSAAPECVSLGLIGWYSAVTCGTDCMPAAVRILLERAPELLMIDGLVVLKQLFIDLALVPDLPSVFLLRRRRW